MTTDETLRAERDRYEELWQLAVQAGARTAGQNETLKLQRDVAEFRIHRVRDLHQPVDAGIGPSCDVCSNHGDTAWPCATLRALDDNITRDGQQRAQALDILGGFAPELTGGACSVCWVQWHRRHKAADVFHDTCRAILTTEEQQ